MDWQLADAKNRFSELVTKALSKGPQRVRRRGDSVIVIAEADYLRATGKAPNLKDYILNGPDFTGLTLKRTQSPMRKIKL